ncbi:hypothetical protein GW17_00062050 [Ensete ventricosum]|nr:hypothetical protein GW17_00062050 [Ensete ventricosum]
MRRRGRSSGRQQQSRGGNGEQWQAATHDGWQRWEVGSREEGEKQGRGGDQVGVCDRGLQAAMRRRLRVGCSSCSGRWQGWSTVMKRRGGTTMADGGRNSRGRGSSGGKDGRGEGCGSRVSMAVSDRGVGDGLG